MEVMIPKMSRHHLHHTAKSFNCHPAAIRQDRKTLHNSEYGW